MQTQTGTWMYLPHASGENPGNPEASPASSIRSRRRRRKRLQPGGPDAPSSSAGGEQADSELMTHDPIVEPSEPRASARVPPSQCLSGPRLQHASQPRASQPQSTPSVGSHEDRLLGALRKLVQQKSHNDEDDWNMRKGPEKGIRWRTGQHPL